MAEQNNLLYIGQDPAKDGFFTHQQTIDGNHIIESAVLAGPVTFPNTITVNGVLVVI
tara:strand:- start:206 stop:376 length:171 start_codon:yes stop_codon:yes gene_type:complete